MQESIDVLKGRQRAGAGQAPPPLAGWRAAFVPGDRLHPLPGDVLVSEVNAGGVPAHWRFRAAGGGRGQCGGRRHSRDR
jgi:monoterpene epsilon-lactone hydrolase